MKKVKIIGWSTRYEGKTYPQGSVLTIRDDCFVENHMELLETLETEDNSIDISALGKAELKALLNEKGIEYSSRATKEQLLDLLGA